MPSQLCCKLSPCKGITERYVHTLWTVKARTDCANQQEIWEKNERRFLKVVGIVCVKSICGVFFVLIFARRF